MLERDGWAPYRRFAHARHQTCLAHLTSLLRTATQQDRDPLELLICLLQAPTPIVADLAIPGH